MDGENTMSKKYHNAKFKILGKIFTVKRLKGMLENGVMGRCLFDAATIYIDESLDGHHLEHTLIHELGHALSYSSSIYQSLPPELEEVLVDVYATFLLDNFALRKLEKKKRVEN